MEKVAVGKLIEVGRLLYTEGLVDARAGNLSFKLDNSILITRRGTHLGRLNSWDFIKVPLEGRYPLEERASSELRVHRKVYLHTSYRSVVHAHPLATVQLSLELDLIEPVDSEGKELLGKVPVIECYPSGSEELAVAVCEAILSAGLVVVRSHGVFSASFDPFYAYAHISVLERSCKILQYERGKIQRL
ncbi:MAG: class II aldolase/adducin family protein [Aquificaceae bacterium]|nr:class II aldolase/adducin family protein [Aquificaceae bacterium]